ncbi:3-carboxy-cis,cis-mucoante lactonizing enzyme [Trematosphaeria pertusa]|uniref:3-carboxy-cis,cis-mucoante lactonizing enzyme n=1 Tax=Trematosphaeria pertusa TaxID=390896 RepID=A0A6A6IML0_9PLEO|nr:3-carboxy-cis,cis-mucoante lactonizing enzyme [Trematosphaeria pertusa]KAF2251467.1 3-carboxy-cis,cis-mucoante lactonizing enzyme [Trematosphaeria pertusa]
MGKHHLMIGTWTPPGVIITVAFDDEKLTLELVKKTEIPADEPISWMAFDHQRKNIYGASMKKWSSHRVDSPSDIVHTGSFEIGGHPKANDVDTKTRAIFLLPARKPPYAVYCNPFYDYAGYGNIFSTNPDGSLMQNIQNYEYCDKSAIHGMVFDPTETYLYSADMWANRIWCHKKIDEEGRLETVGFTEAEGAKDHPRWVEMHPSGRYLYALMEAGNRVCEYVVDPKTRLPVYTHRWWPLIPPDIPNPHMYRSDVVFLTQSARYLFATSRANSFSLTGYIAAFAISPSGAIERQICLNPTPTSGGHSNAVSPCPWTDEWLALTDDEKGGVEIYRWHKEFLARVARLEVGEKGFGMNAIWYD